MCCCIIPADYRAPSLSLTRARRAFAAYKTHGRPRFFAATFAFTFFLMTQSAALPGLSRPRRRCLRFSLRSLLVFITVFGVWLGVKVNQARRQKEAVEALKNSGAYVRYAHQRDDADPERYYVQEPDVPR